MNGSARLTCTCTASCMQVLSALAIHGVPGTLQASSCTALVLHSSFIFIKLQQVLPSFVPLLYPGISPYTFVMCLLCQFTAQVYTAMRMLAVRYACAWCRCFLHSLSTAARAYLDDLRAATTGGDEGDDDNDAAAGAGGLDDGELAEKLRQDALEAQGRLQRRLAHRLLLPDQSAPSTSGRSSFYGAGCFARAHRLSPTAVALAADERTAYTVAKDGSILKWDLETMQRTQIVRCVGRECTLQGFEGSCSCAWQYLPNCNESCTTLQDFCTDLRPIPPAPVTLRVASVSRCAASKSQAAE